MKNERNSSVEREAQRALKSCLREDEALLWSGRPYASHPYRPPMAILIFMLFWCGFAIFWTVTALMAGGLFGLLGLPFVLIGVSMLYFLLIGQKNLLYNTIYAVTDSRLILLTATRKGLSCTEYALEHIGFLHYTEIKDGAGHITFVPLVAAPSQQGRRARRWERFVGFRSSNSAERDEGTLYMIDNVREVFTLLSEQLANRKRV